MYPYATTSHALCLDNEINSADFGDKRLTSRATKLLRDLSRCPKYSINASTQGAAETMAAYRFLSNHKVTSDLILQPHRQRAIQRASEYPSVRLIQDTSEADFTSLKTLKGSGPLSTEKRRGTFLHTSLLVAAGGLPLGVLDIDFMTREDRNGRKKIPHKQRPLEEKESFRWLTGYRDACNLQLQLPSSEVISVADREADMYEIFSEYEHLAQHQKPAHFLIRAKENRVLLDELEGRKLFDLTDSGEALGTIEFDIPSQTQKLKIKGIPEKYQRLKRKVTQELRVHKVTPRPPYRKDVKFDPVTFYMVSAREVNEPEGQRPIIWRLLTSKPVSSFKEAHEIVLAYVDRWQVEVFFKVLKTGCKIEEIGLKNIEGIKRSIAMFSLIAWKQLYLTYLAREQPDSGCSMVFERHEWEGTLKVLSNGKAELNEPNLKEFMLQIAKLGGYLNRKHDPPPGPECLWKGILKVESYGEAWLAFTSMK